VLNTEPTPEAIRQLVRELGEAAVRLSPSRAQLAQLRAFFGYRVLRAEVDDYIQGKYDLHVEEDRHWPDDTTPAEYLLSIRETVLDQRSAIYLTASGPDQTWSVYFVGRVRRAWRGPRGSNRVVVIFNAEYHRFVTGFQPDDDEEYVEQQDGFWLYHQ
jgi:hypothetical protein